MLVLRKESKVNKTIPDGDTLTDVVDIHRDGNVESIKVSVNITHSFVGDLTVKLTSPSGKTVTLHDREGGSGDDINMVYEGDIFADMVGSSAKGQWKLEATDNAPRDEGTLDSWNIDVRLSGDHNSEIFIPDGDSGLRSSQMCDYDGVVKSMNLYVNVEHPFVGDLQVALVAPSGNHVVLHNREGGSSDNLDSHYTSDGKLAAFIGESTKGEWELQVRDHAPRDSGTLKRWRLEFNFQDKHDLSKIEGIGGKTSDVLNRGGIYTYAQLASTPEDRLKSILSDAGGSFANADTQTWGNQARLAATGQWDKLTKWQKEYEIGKDIPSFD